MVVNVLKFNWLLQIRLVVSIIHAAFGVHNVFVFHNSQQLITKEHLNISHGLVFLRGAFKF